jgi:hypothetical protein
VVFRRLGAWGRKQNRLSGRRYVAVFLSGSGSCQIALCHTMHEGCMKIEGENKGWDSILLSFVKPAKGLGSIQSLSCWHFPSFNDSMSSHVFLKVSHYKSWSRHIKTSPTLAFIGIQPIRTFVLTNRQPDIPNSRPAVSPLLRTFPMCQTQRPTRLLQQHIPGRNHQHRHHKAPSTSPHH